MLRGTAEAIFFENGSAKIVFLIKEVKGYDSSHPLGLGLLGFFKGQSNWIGNVCEEFVLHTETGSLKTVGPIHYTFAVGGGQDKLIILAAPMTFTTKAAAPPAFWLLPLTNCTTSLFYTYPDLDRHSLRRSWIPGRESLDSQRRKDETEEDVRLIVFEREGNLEFIELLPNFADLVNLITAGVRRSAVTAIMVGNVGHKSVRFEDVNTWLPFDLLLFLSVGSGPRVDYPWIEFWSGEGTLVSRIHTVKDVHGYTKGHRAIEEEIHGGTGYFLTQALKSPLWGTIPIRICLANYLRGSGTWQMDDRNGYFSRALDSLAAHYGVSSQSLLNGLDANTADQVKQICKTAASEIRALAQGSNAENLDRISQRVTNAFNTERLFGLSVVELMKHFGLIDWQILEAHYITQPRPDKRTWPGLLSTCRGTALHGGSFSHLGPRYQDDLFEVGQHLQDLILRVIFLTIAYDHVYDPPVIPGLASMDVNWVDQNRSANDLGYK